MPTFDNPLADAAEASEALRGLAHATRSWDDPADTYRVIGELAAGMRSLHQILGQLAATHSRRHDQVSTDDGDRAAGAQAALAAAAGFEQAAALIDRADDQISAAFAQSGRIVWHPRPAQAEQWISVVFLQGDEADEVLDLIDAQGTDAAIEHLAGYDYGDETVEAAIANGHAYDEPQAGATDRTATRDVYTLTYNASLGHVGLYREATALPDPALLGIDTPIEMETVPVAGGSVEARRVAGPADRNWFASPASSGDSDARRGLSL